jgi:hypothetical protein
MIKKLIVVSACVAASAGAASADSWRQAGKWRLRPVLIDQWSLFSCTAMLPGRFWDFTLLGQELSAAGPEGMTWTTTVAEDGSFRVNFVGSWRGQAFSAEVKGNVDSSWAIQHNSSAMCWYHLMPPEDSD